MKKLESFKSFGLQKGGETSSIIGGSLNGETELSTTCTCPDGTTTTSYDGKDTEANK